ncbi:MAG: permease [Candidatus Margulisiibacteriota bacterium]
MLVSTILLGIIASIMVGVGVFNGQGQHLSGLKAAYQMTLQTIPLLIFAFIIAGMVQVLVPKDIISRWVGPESGLMGILMGTLAGCLMPGGPYVVMPMAAGMLKAGAGIGTMVAFMTGWGLLSFSRVIMEVGIIGWRFTAIRIASTFLFAPLAGLIAHFLTAGK